MRESVCVSVWGTKYYKILPIQSGFIICVSEVLANLKLC